MSATKKLPELRVVCEETLEKLVLKFSDELLVYKKCPIKSPETATKIGQNCLKLHEITKVKKIAKIATRNLTQFHPISFNFKGYTLQIAILDPARVTR